MHRRTARGNRLGLALTGVLLAAAGAALLLAHQGLLGSADRRDVLYPARSRTFVHDNGSWLWPVVAAVAIVIALLFLRWLLVQPRTDRLRRLVIDTDEHAGTDPSAGRTRMPAAALTDIVEEEVGALRGVRGVTAALTGHPDAPKLWLTVSTEADADVARIRRAITGGIVDDARTCLDQPHLTTYLKLCVTRRAGGRTVRPTPDQKEN